MKQEDLRAARIIEARRRAYEKFREDGLSRMGEMEHLADLYETCWTPPEPAARRPAEWQPIGPEQRDGKPILAGSVNHECREIVDWQDYGEDGEGWVNTGAVKDRFYANPRWFTHYQPLPAAPKVTT